MMSPAASSPTQSSVFAGVNSDDPFAGIISGSADDDDGTAAAAAAADDDDEVAPLIDVGGGAGGGGGGVARRRGQAWSSSSGGGGGGGGASGVGYDRTAPDDGCSRASPSLRPQRRGPSRPLGGGGGHGPVSPPADDGERDSKGRSPRSRAYSALSEAYRQLARWGARPSREMSKHDEDEGPDGTYYRDDFNDESWSCNPGTGEESGIWMNTTDQAGTVMALLVWFLLAYSAVTVTMLAETGGVPPSLSMAYAVLCCMALACHAKTTFTDPGAVPQSAVPVESMRGWDDPDRMLSMCSQCQTFKPPFSHHCRICNRCIARMDHHCPWMNNCIGAGNLKHFILFLLYTWACSASSLLLLGWNYFFCADEDCVFTPVLIQLVRVMTVLSVASFLFTSSMIMNVSYGLLTGIGTIDRLKKKATGTMQESTEEPVSLSDVFGMGGWRTWPIPTDPIFPDYDRVMGYSTPQRLLREQMRENPNSPGFGGDYAPSAISKGSRAPSGAGYAPTAASGGDRYGPA